MSSLLRVTAESFSIIEHRLAESLSQQMFHDSGHRPSRSEAASWTMSIPALVRDLKDAGLGQVEIMLEYRLPLTSKRADVVLAGVHPSGRPHYVVVELKQWSTAHLYESDEKLVVVDNWHSHPMTHPVAQVHSYCEYLQDYAAVLSGTPESVAGVAYLHNATDYSVQELIGTTHGGRLFTGQRRGEFIDYLRTQFAPEPGQAAADHLLASKIEPSKQLLKLAAETVQSRQMFALLDEQLDAYNIVLHAVATARQSGRKTAVIVTGGPGSGKSVIALSVLGELARQGRTVVHATGSRSFTQTLRKVAAKGNRRVQQEFKYFNSFMDAQPNDLECLILDEAHRIRQTSANRFTKAALRTGRPQIDELLSAARVPVFLLDEYQVVRPGEMGTVDEIVAAASTQGLEVTQIDLDAQFRCGGSANYVNWVRDLLELGDGEPTPWSGDDGFEVTVHDSPDALEEWLIERSGDGYSARMSAGYCWPWSDPRPDGTLVPDVRIGDWARPWNLKGDRSVGGAPASQFWATDPAGFGQVGCIYTAQGFEYDYAGVIIGNDFVRRGGDWVLVREGNKDPDFRNRTKVGHEQFDALIRNVYKVLLTRGLRGVGIFSVDPETREWLHTLCDLSPGISD